jgi:hypothetical protein
LLVRKSLKKALERLLYRLHGARLGFPEQPFQIHERRGPPQAFGFLQVSLSRGEITGSTVGTGQEEKGLAISRPNLQALP